MEDFMAYFHVDETNSVYKTLGYIHDTFVRELPENSKVYVGWEEEPQQTIRYRTKIESPTKDNDDISSAFHNIVASFNGQLRLGILLSKPRRSKFVLLSLVEV